MTAEIPKRRGVPNDDIGRANALAGVRDGAYEKYEAALDYMLSIASRAEQAPTLADYAAALIAAGFPPPRTSWSQMAVKRVLLTCGGWTAKTMYADLMRERDRSTVIVKEQWPQELHEQWAAWAKAETDLSERNGDWVSAVTVAPLDGDHVQFLSDEGQPVAPDDEAWEVGAFILEVRPGTARVQVVTAPPLRNLLNQIEWPMAKLRVWCWRLSPEERFAQGEAKRADIFRQNRRIDR